MTSPVVPDNEGGDLVARLDAARAGPPIDQSEDERRRVREWVERAQRARRREWTIPMLPYREGMAP